MSKITEMFNTESNPVVYRTSLSDEIANFFGFSEMLKISDKVTGENNPAVEDLPQSFQNMLKSIGEVEPIDKLNVIHSFVFDYMTYKLQEGSDPKADINDIIKNEGIGDCDDYASLEMALLKYAGFDEEKIAFVGVKVSYESFESSSGKKDYEPHAVVVVEVDGKMHLMDSNVEEVSMLKPVAHTSDLNDFRAIGENSLTGETQLITILTFESRITRLLFQLRRGKRVTSHESR